MKRFAQNGVLVVALLFFASVSLAHPIDVETAKQVGVQFLNAHIKTPVKSASDLQLATTYNRSQGVAACYVFNTFNGFVIVAADDCTSPILGYSDEGRPFDPDHVPEPVQAFLQEYVEQIQYAIDHQLKPIETVGHRDKTQIGPLLTTTWDQGQYYNAMCPEDPNGPGGYCRTGSAATLMAQLVKYWEFPKRGRGAHVYESENYGTLSVDFEASEYDFDKMPDQLTDQSSQEEVNAVAKLISDCGRAASTYYLPNAGGANFYNMMVGLFDFYGYASDMGICRHSMYSEEDWGDLLRSNIAASKPIMYCGTAALYYNYVFIVDGFDSDDFFHLNFGFGGEGDGWYRLFNVIPSYNLYVQFAILNIHPSDETHTIVGTDGTNSFTVGNALDFYHTLGANSMRVELDDYGFEGSWLLQPEDPEQQLTLDFLDYQDETLAIYDGIGMDHLLRIVSPDNVENDLSSLVSTRHGLTIVNTANLGPKGFHLRVAEESECRMATNIGVDKKYGFIYLFWDKNGPENTWKVEYGPKGFASGEGTVILADTNCIKVYLDDMDAMVEFKIQPACGISDDLMVNSYVMNDNLYWSDAVTSQPEGYAVGPDGTIFISSAEGLGWMAKHPSIESDVVFLADINLADHPWNPIKNWHGNVYGNGHVIRNMQILDMPAQGAVSYAGLFSYYTGDTIRDLGFENTVIVYHLIGCAGTIAGMAGPSTVAVNCFSDHFSLYSDANNEDVGGLFGFSNGILVNCYASGNIRSGNVGGGLVGNGSQAMYNCYSSIKYMDAERSWEGLLQGYTRSGTYVNCFADIDYVKDDWTVLYIGSLFDADHTAYGYFFGCPTNINYVRNVAGFTKRDTPLAYTVPETSLNYQYGGSVDLVTALNTGVADINSPLLREWVWDENTGYPVFGGYHEVSCPNVSNIAAENVVEDNEFAVALSWQDNSNAERWIIKCLPYGEVQNDSAVYYTSTTPHCFLTGLTMGKKYEFYVRPACDTTVWGLPFAFWVDKCYWTDVVTERPEGYIVDAHGNVTISSAEGLAWLSVCSNGLQGQSVQTYEGETVSIVADIDLGAYRWMPISMFPSYGTIQFSGTLEGNGNLISNLYCNEEKDYIGLVGYLKKAVVENVVLIDSRVSGGYYVGSLFGQALESSIFNCQVRNANVSGISFVGGLGGGLDSYDGPGLLINSSSSGVVYGDEAVGGLCGFNYRNYEVYNCYSTAEVLTLGKIMNATKGGLFGGSNGVVLNCYSAGDVEFVYNYQFLEYGVSLGSAIGSLNFPDQCYVSNVYGIAQDDVELIGSWSNPACVVANSTSFSDSGVLEQTITVGQTNYTELLPVLNAWVDANTSGDDLLRWMDDAAMTNGGFPVLEELDRYEIDAVADTASNGVVKGAGTYIQGATATLEARPRTGYKFLKWMKDGVEVSTLATYSFTVVGPARYVACFVRDNHGVTESEETVYMTLYPNPVHRHERIQCDIPQNETITELVITDMLGNTIRHEQGVVEANSIRGLAKAGVYVVEAVTASGKVLRGRLVVR